ncbi:MAG: efflux RND transporter periplasmic adaptor subunit [Acidobacteriota bacterium]
MSKDRTKAVPGTYPGRAYRGLSLRLATAAALGVCLLVTSGCAPGQEPAAAETTAAPTAGRNGAETAPREERVPVVTVTTVEPYRAVDLASLPADILPLRRAVLAAEVAGRVESVRAEEGRRIGSGAVLVAIDTRSLAQALAEAEAVDRQRRAQFDRAQQLLERRSITQSQFLDAVTFRDVAAAQLASARLQLEKSTVAAPWGGTVAKRHVEVGDYVTPGQPVVELLDTRRVKVRAPAPASDVPFLRTGLPVRILVDSLPAEPFEGQVARLAAELDASARTLDVEIEIDNEDGRLKPGMVARVELPRRVIEDALRVPLEALVELDDGTVVYVVEGERAEQRTVSLGPVLDGDLVVVTAGLAAGDRVVVEGQRSISPGQKVLVTGDVSPTLGVEG